jgi:hypothetical protein
MTTQGSSFETGFAQAQAALEAGDWDRAEALAAELAARHGGLPATDWIRTRVELGRGRLDAALQLARGLAGAPGLAPAQRADAMLLQAQALDRLGRAGEAFAAAIQGKAVLRRLYTERAAGRERQLDKLERLRRWFEAAGPAPWRAAPPEGPVPGEAAGHAFILGFPRSGTTLLEQALAGHPQVVALEEAPTLAEPYAEFLSSEDGCERLARLDGGEAQAWRARYWAQVAALGVDPSGRLFVDKAPAETLSLPLIARLFPKARLFFALRDPRDVVLSCLLNHFQLNALTYAFTDLAETAEVYAATMALAEVYRRLLPLDVMEVRHETLIADFPAQIAAVAAFLGIEPHPAMADPAAVARGRRVLTPSAPQVRAGLSLRGVGRWRAYAAELEPVMATLEPWVGRFGYDQA